MSNFWLKHHRRSYTRQWEKLSWNYFSPVVECLSSWQEFLIFLRDIFNTRNISLWRELANVLVHNDTYYEFRGDFYLWKFYLIWNKSRSVVQNFCQVKNCRLFNPSQVRLNECTRDLSSDLNANSLLGKNFSPYYVSYFSFLDENLMKSINLPSHALMKRRWNWMKEIMWVLVARRQILLHEMSQNGHVWWNQNFHRDVNNNSNVDVLFDKSKKKERNILRFPSSVSCFLLRSSNFT